MSLDIYSFLTFLNDTFIIEDETQELSTIRMKYILALES